MRELQPEETDLLGRWEFSDGRVIEDTVADRIRTLIAEQLEKVAGGGWEVLYRDPTDGRYWQLTYPESHMQGGGPPRLTYLSQEQVRAAYGDL